MNKVLVFCIMICSAFAASAQEIGNKIKKLPVNENYAQDSTLSKSLISIPVEKYVDTSLFFNDGTYHTFRYLDLKDFSLMQNGPLFDNLTYTISGTRNTWAGITTINTAYFGVNYSAERFQFDAGGTLLKYDYAQRQGFHKNFTDALVSGTASYDILPWLTVGAYGQYSLQSKSNFNKGAILPTPMIPYSAFGAFSRIMFTPKFGIEGSVGKQFNPLRGKWEDTYSIGPAIRLK